MSSKCAYFALLMKLESWLPALHPPLNFGKPPPFCHKTFAQVIPPVSIVPPTQLHPQQHKTISNHHDTTRPSTLHTHTPIEARSTPAGTGERRLHRFPIDSITFLYKVNHVALEAALCSTSLTLSRRISHNDAKLPATKKGTKTNHPLLR